MSGRWQELTCFGLRLTGIPWFMREIYARHKVTIVNYHDPCPETFARHIEFFARAYSFISIDQLSQAFEKKNFSDLPPKPMLVTFDDGHIGNAQLFPIIRQYRIPVVFYAVAGVVDTNRGFWFDRLPHGGDAMRRLKSLPDADRRSVLQQEYGYSDEREYEDPVALSAEQLREFIEIGGTIGSHTVSHPLLGRCEDTAGQFECVESRRMLEAMVGQPVRHFALPGGSYDERTKRWLTKARYVTCRTTNPGTVSSPTDRMELRNFGIADTAGIRKAVVQASGIWDMLKMICTSFRARFGGNGV